MFSLESNLPTNLIGDPLRLSQILLNLSNNAVKFTDEGEIVVMVELLEETEDDALIQFSVKDTGIGLTREQADSSTTRKYGGIGVNSEYGKGSTFYFTARLGRQQRRKNKKTLIPDSIKDLSVLVVDDNDASREVMAHYLENFSFEVDTVSSGYDAITTLKQQKRTGQKGVDLIFMDW